MKITGSGQIAGTLQAELEKQQQRRTGAFDAVLEETMAGRAATNEASTSVHPPLRVSMPPLIDPDEAVGRLEAFLDLMDRYSEQIGSQSTLKEIAPLVERMRMEKDQLQMLSDRLPDDDEVRPLLQEAIIRSSVEIVKFNRGDYL